MTAVRQIGLGITAATAMAWSLSSLAAAEIPGGAPAEMVPAAPDTSRDPAPDTNSDAPPPAAGSAAASEGSSPTAPPSTSDAGPGDVSPPPIAQLLTGGAKRDYEAGRELFDKGDFARALLRFRNAHRLSHDPRLLWNMAACEVKLFRFGKAIVLIRRYLHSGSRLIRPHDLDRAKEFLKAAERMTVAFDVESNVPGARVYLDGELVGTAPLGSKVRVDPGQHEVVVKQDGFKDFTETIIVGSKDHHVQAVLEPIAREGRVIVHAGPGNRIALDGVAVGTGTWEGVVPSGPHSLRVTAPGARPFETEILVAEDRTRTVDVKLQPAPHATGLPAWVWIAGGVVAVAGAATAGYLIFRPADDDQGPTGSIATIHLPLH